MSYAPAQQAKHCRQLADFLETLRPEQYDHDTWGREHPDCGTPVCALGWAAHAGIGGMQWRPTMASGKVVPWYPGCSRGPVSCAEVVFGERASDEVFDYCRPDPDSDEPTDPLRLSIHRLRSAAAALDAQS